MLLDRRYRVDGLLARGGMSAVYRGVDTRLDRPVAIKIMDPRFADDRSFVERFEREARSAAKLHHPHVVAVHDQGVDASREQHHAFLVMELVDGGTLRDLLREHHGKLDVALALSVAEHVLAALAAAHDAGLVHRDVKPENVLIGRGGTPGAGVVKVADFGLVRAVASAGTTSSSVILGTVSYLAPEQVTTGAASARGDVYSAGILLYEMLTGKTPYTGDTALSVAYRHVNDDVPAPSASVPEIPPAVDELVLRATRRDPDARPSDAKAFLEELHRVRNELGIPEVAIPIPPAPDADHVSDNEVTVPGIATQVTPVGMSSPHGTRALDRPQAEAAFAANSDTPGAEEHPPAARRRRRVVLISVAVVMAALIGAGLWWFLGGRYVSVPSVAGLDQPTAEKTLRAAGLAPHFTQARDNSVKSGLVIRTDPSSGGDVLRDEEVTVVMSLGRPVVPTIALGASEEEADSALRAVQLQPRKDVTANKYDATAPVGTVLALTPKPGTQLDIDTPVLVVLSKGPPPTPVPMVVGKTHDEAFQALRAAGFEPVEGGAEFSAAVGGGKVTRTDPAPGVVTEDGSKQVKVWISTSVTVPSLTGQTVDQAVSQLAALGLQAEASNRNRKNFGFVIGQSVDAGTLVEKGTTVQLSVFP
jgi:serine/threonine-protein kinase